MKKALYILGHMTDEEIAWLITHGEKEIIMPGVDLVKPDMPIEGLYMVLEGTLHLLIDDQPPIVLGNGEIIGEMSFVDQRLARATIRSATQVMLLTIPRELLEDKLETDVSFAAHFYRAIAIFLAHLIETSTLLGYGDASMRVPAATDPDELDDSVLDIIHLAGSHFQNILNRFTNI